MKLISLVLAVAMVLGMMSVAFAEPQTEITNPGSLVIKNSEKDVVYNLYRILDLTGQDTSDPADNVYDAVVYKLNSKWTAFWTGTGAGASYIVANNDTTANGGKGLATINVDGVTKYINITDSNKVAFTNAAMKYAIDNNVATDKTADP